MKRNCVVCETNKYADHYCEVDGYEYALCSNCGLIYINRLEKTENIYKAYSGSSLKSLRRKMMAPFRQFHQAKNFEQSTARAKNIFGFAQQQVSGKGKYLDIGCNKGFLLAQGIENGWDIYGCELVPELTVPFCNTYKQYRDHVYQGRFCDVRGNFSSNQLDLITAIDVIEHFEDVEDDMKAIYNILKPGGAFVIQTPDVDCAQAKELGEKWGALKPLEHLHLFNIDNLTTFAKRIGYSAVEPVDEVFEDADGNFVAVLRK